MAQHSVEKMRCHSFHIIIANIIVFGKCQRMRRLHRDSPPFRASAKISKLSRSRFFVIVSSRIRNPAGLTPTTPPDHGSGFAQFDKSRSTENNDNPKT